MLVLLVAACKPTQPRSATTEVAEHGRATPEQSSNACRTVLLAGRASRGVLFGAECGPSIPIPARSPTLGRVVGYWEPTSDVIEVIEANLRPALENERSKYREMAHAAGADDDSVEWATGATSALNEILDHYSGYRRQYLGIVVTGGVKRVLVSSFPAAVNGAPDEFPNWREKWVDVDDGGSEFWRIEYEIGSGSFVGFDVNASA